MKPRIIKAVGWWVVICQPNCRLKHQHPRWRAFSKWDDAMALGAVMHNDHHQNHLLEMEVTC